VHPAVEALTVDIWMLPKQHRLPGSDIRIRGMPARSLTLPFAFADGNSSDHFSTPARAATTVEISTLKTPFGVTIRKLDNDRWEIGSGRLPVPPPVPLEYSATERRGTLLQLPGRGVAAESALQVLDLLRPVPLLP
jgi:hypothetical protein